MNFLIHITITILIFMIVVGGYNLTLGSLGMLHLGQMAFFAIGAYTSALLVMNGAPFLVGIFAAAALASLAGYIIGIPCLRIKDDYLVLITLGLSEVIRLVALNWVGLTDGPLGLRAIPRPAIFGMHFITKQAMLPLYAIITAIVLIILYKIMHSPYGKVLEAIREDEIGAESLGKNIMRYKLQALVISAALAGLGGALFAHFQTYIDPTMGAVKEMVLVVIMLIVGGVGSFWGAIIGPAVIVSSYELLRLLPDFMRSISAPTALLDFMSKNVGTIQISLYSIIFMLIVIYRQRGICGRLGIDSGKK